MSRERSNLLGEGDFSRHPPDKVSTLMKTSPSDGEDPAEGPTFRPPDHAMEELHGSVKPVINWLERCGQQLWNEPFRQDGVKTVIE
ncbi:unnamed protein product [Nesidiocoris tenuis]|uniref:Uncharacterized protein n=1 Tax=Nesidiocoris tenuis TaxID=355587 RepID=A0A6H5GFV8_9HEMI|nr:unnamed protein product [Nesidiocoris tenuis]